MGITLNIVENELASYGHVDRMELDNPQLEDVRLFLGGKPLRPDTLYVCERIDDAQSVLNAGCHAVYVPAPDAPASENKPGFTLTVSGDNPALVVFDALLDLFHRYDEWQNLMDRIAYDGGTLQDLLDISESFLLNNVVILDPALKLLGYTRGIPCDDPITVALIEHGYHTEENIRKFKLHRRFKPWSESDGFVVNDTRMICKYTTVVKSFKTRSAFSLIAVMMCNVVDCDPYLLDAYEMLTDRVRLFALRDYPDDKPSGSAVDTFLKDLFNGAVEDEAAIAERSSFVGIPHDGRFCLFYIKPGENSVPNSRLLADVSLSVAPAKTVLVDDAVIVLCFNCQSSTCAQHCVADTCPLKKHTVSRRLNDMLDRYDLTCGRSSKFTGLAHARIAYEQAKRAYALSENRAAVAVGQLEYRMWNRIFSFDAYAMNYLVSSLSSDDAAMLDLTYTGAILAEIAKQDLASKTNNYEFLYTYLVYERRITVVAETLHMHRNNVSYRINRIEEQFGIDTSDAKLRQDMLLAYFIRNAIVQEAQ